MRLLHCARHWLSQGAFMARGARRVFGLGILCGWGLAIAGCGTSTTNGTPRDLAGTVADLAGLDLTGLDGSGPDLAKPRNWETRFSGMLGSADLLGVWGNGLGLVYAVA